jgi:hypothetical protein
MCDMTALLIPFAVDATRRLVAAAGPDNPRTRRR